MFSLLVNQFGDPVDCCDNSTGQDPFRKNPEFAEVCYNIKIQRGDLGRDDTCVNFVRSW